MNSHGQTAIVDAIIFMILLTMATAIIVSAPGSTGDTYQEKVIQQYSSDFADTLLSMDVPNYSGKNAGTLLTEAALLSMAGANVSDIEREIGELATSLIRPDLCYVIECRSSSGPQVFVSETIDDIGQLPGDRAASTITYQIDGEEIVISCYVWWRQ